MKNRVVSGGSYILLGLLISLGPLYLFRVCEAMGDEFMICHWTSRAELGVGLLISILGVLILLIPSAQTRSGVNISIAFTGVLAFSIPTVLIGVCEMPKMNCHAVTAPSILVTSILVVLLSIANGIYLVKKSKKSEESR